MKKNYRGFGRHSGGVILPSCTSVFLLCISLFSFAQGDTWQQKQSLGLAATSRYQAVGFSIGDKGYTGGGIDVGAPLIDFWEYDPATNVWTQKANLPGARSSATGFSIGNKGYIGNKDFWEYDPATNIWTRKADFGGAGASGATGFSIGNKGYMGTGRDSLSKSTNDFWEFDPTTNAWMQKANFGGGVRNGASSFSIGNKGYIGLGKADLMGALSYSDFWEYDPATDTWVQKANFGGGTRWGATGFSVGNKGFLGTGNGFTFHSLNDFWEYDPATNVWVQTVNFAGDAREQAIGFSIGNKGYIGTGYRTIDQNTFGPTNDFWEYDTALNTWAQKASLGGGPREGAVGFSIAGKGYVGTGYDGSAKKDFWEYDTVTGQWMQKADFAGGERQQGTGFGVGGTGYVGQGYITGQSNYKNDLWRYDPVTTAWTPGVGPGFLPRDGAITFGIGGEEYFGMGFYRATALTDLWVFDPSTGVWTQKANFAGVAGSAVAGFGIGNKGYSVGAGVWEYDPATNAWTQKANPAAGNLVYAFSSSTKGYALTTNNAFWEYDPASDTWVNRASFPGPARQGATAFSIGNNGYFGFGSTTNGFKNDFWEYIPPGPGGNSITTTVAPDTFCSRSTVTVSFIAKGPFNAGNIFTAELSDSSGGFSMPKSIGTDTSVVSGVMNSIVPDSIKSGQAYRIRVVSSSPVITGSDNGVNLVINPPPVARAKDLTIYLNERGIATLRPEEVDSGSVAYCGGLKAALDDTIFNCKDIGLNKVKLTVTDANGNKATDTAIITVLDSLKPLITDAFAIPNTLWPPDHKMRRVTVYYRDNDNCGVASKSLSVTSNEPPVGSRPDWIILDDHHLLLRAEINERRSKERIYYITITVRDSSGNSGTEVVKVVVSRHGRDDDRSEPGDDKANDEVVSKEAGTGVNGLIVSAQPNPAHQNFTLVFRSNNDQPIIMRVVDNFGRLIEIRTNVVPNGVLQIGNGYRPGNYYVQVIQGEDLVTLHLVKLPK